MKRSRAAIKTERHNSNRRDVVRGSSFRGSKNKFFGLKIHEKIETLVKASVKSASIFSDGITNG